MVTKIILAILAGIAVAIWIWAYGYFSDDHTRAALIIFSIIAAAVTSRRTAHRTE